MRSTTSVVRELTAEETRITARLLEAEFASASEVREQARRSSVRAQDYGGVLVLAFDTSAGLPTARVKHRVPVEAQAPDADGVMIHLLLHVVDGVLTEIEIFREDSKPIRRLPRSEDLHVVVN